MQEEWFIDIEIIYMESPITVNIFEIFLSRRFEHNHN